MSTLRTDLKPEPAPTVRPKPTLVMKFGGTSVASIERMRVVAGLVRKEVDAGFNVAVVVSAMGHTTDELVTRAEAVGRSFDAREYDVLLSAGEQISAALMAMVLQAQGISARSWMGWQLPIHTDARHNRAFIQTINVDAMQQRLNDGIMAVCAGFQGVDARGRITTLGRGGSDTTAVALAVALGAVRCDIYTDVKGIFICDPRIVADVQLIRHISTEEMLELASLGAKVLHARCVKIAMRYGMPLRVLSSFDSDPGTLVDSSTNVNLRLNQRFVMPRDHDPPSEQDTPPRMEVMEGADITGVAVDEQEALITVRQVPDHPGMAAKLFGAIAGAGVDVDMIIQSSASGRGATDLSFTVAISDIAQAQKALSDLTGVPMQNVAVDENMVKVSVVGIGMQSTPGVAHKIFTALGDNAINIHAISTSEIKVSLLIESRYAELAVRVLYDAFRDEIQRNERA